MRELFQIRVRSLPQVVFLEFWNDNVERDYQWPTFRAIGSDAIFFVDRRWNNFTLAHKIRERVEQMKPYGEFFGFSYGDNNYIKVDLNKF